MNICLKAEFIWSDRQSRYLRVYDKSIFWTKGVAECKGASDSEKNIAQQQSSYYNTLQNDYKTQFTNQSNILNSLNKSLSPIVNAGVGQYGFSNAEDASMRNQSTSGTASAYKSAKQATGEAQAAQGGGDSFIGSGVKAQTNAQLANSAASTEANQQLGITQQGYQQGRQNYFGAVNQEQQVASTYNPSGYASAANSAGNSAFSSADTVNKEDQAGSASGIIGGLAGGALSAFAGGMGGGIGEGLGKKFSS